MGCYLGIEIGGTKLQLVLGSEVGKPGRRQKCVVDPGKGAAGIREQIERAVPETARGQKNEAIGGGFWRTGGLADGKNLPVAPDRRVVGIRFGRVARATGWLARAGGQRCERGGFGGSDARGGCWVYPGVFFYARQRRGGGARGGGGELV